MNLTPGAAPAIVHPLTAATRRMAMTVVTRHVGSVWVEASVGRRGVPKVPDGRDERDERDGRDGRDERDPHTRVCSTGGAGGGRAAGGGASSAALGHVQRVPAWQPGRQQDMALHLGTETRWGSRETSSRAFWQAANHMWPGACVHGGSGGGAGAGAGAPGPGDIITVIIGEKAAALDVWYL